MTDEQLAKIKEATDTALLDFFKIRKSDALSLIARLEAAESRALSAYNEGIEEAAKLAEIQGEYGVAAITRALRKGKP